jgi:adenylate cyclase
MLFADVRGSTTMAERMSGEEFSRIMNRFYATATDVLIRSDAMIDKLVGDEVIGLYLPLFSGRQHARRAVQAARELLRASGHGDVGGPWIPVGIGVHTGVAYVGTVKGAQNTVSDFTALGDSVNITARLASAAGVGEALVSDAAWAAAEVALPDAKAPPPPQGQAGGGVGTRAHDEAGRSGRRFLADSACRLRDAARLS